MTGKTALGSQAIDFAHDHHSAYNPSLSADGRVVAYETSESARGELDVWVTNVKTGRSVLIPEPAGVSSDLYEPAISPDGKFLAFTALAREGARQSQVFLRDLERGITTRVSGAGEAWEPVVAPGGRAVAYTNGTRVVVHSAAGTKEIAPPDASMSASEPSLSADGASRGLHRPRRRRRDERLRPRPLHGRDDARLARLGVHRPTRDGRVRAPLDLSADGTRVAFTSDAWNLSPVEVQPGPRHLRPRPRVGHDDAGLARRRRERGPGPDQGLRLRRHHARPAALRRMNPAMREYYEQRAAEYDDWWLGTGRFEQRDRPGLGRGPCRR